MSYDQNGRYFGHQHQSSAGSYHNTYSSRPTTNYGNEEDQYALNGQSNQYGYAASPQPGRSNSSATRHNDELFMGDSPSSHRPVGPPANPSYTPQYNYAPSPQIPQQGYNPQSYVQLPNPAQFGGVNRTNLPTQSPPLPSYNPAAYADNSLGRANTTASQGYGYPSPQQTYTPSSAHASPQSQFSATMPQASSYFPGGRTGSQRDNRIYNPSHSSQPQQYANTYTAPAPPPPPVAPLSSHAAQDSYDSRYQQSAQSYQHNSHLNASHAQPNSYFSHSSQAHSAQSSIDYGSYANNPLPPTPEAPPAPPHRAGTISRHPQAQPLPQPPHESGNVYNNSAAYGGTAYAHQDELFNQVEDLARNSTASPQLHLNERPLNGEHRPGPPTRTDSSGGRRNAMTNGHLSPGPNHGTFYQNHSDESDAEAAAGLAAMRMADDQDRADEARRESFSPGGHQYTTSSASAPARHQQSYPANDADSDDDYVYADLSSFQGGYDPGHLSYGGQPDELAAGGTVSRHRDSGSLSASNSMRRSEAPSEGASSGEFGVDTIHPFRPFVAPPAVVDVAGTGGLGPPNPDRRRRLSYDEGDEHHFTDLQGHQPDDLFFHPGMTNRPLPPPPPGEPQYPSTADAHSRRHGQIAPNTYAPEGYQVSAPGGTLVPRSTSLLHNPRTPQAVPVARSKTDAEQQRRMNQHQHKQSVQTDPGDVLDLLPSIPAGKRFNPSKLTSADFKKCTEPWALSSVINWIRSMAAGEIDLKESAIVEGLQKLFEYKVPTMGFAELEMLSSHVMQEMHNASVVVREEEWIKFGHATTSGVIFQLTGSGCYSPKVHDGPQFGRCYSHLCKRTVHKMDLGAMEAANQDWASYYKLTAADVEGHDKKEIERQNQLHEVITSENLFKTDVDILRSLYRDDLLKASPPIIPPKKLSTFISSVFGKADAIKQVNEEHLLPQLLYRQKEQGPWITGFSDIFREWIRKAKGPYTDYAASIPQAVSLVKQEGERNLLFKTFLERVQANAVTRRLGLDHFIKAPINRLQRIGLQLSTILKSSKIDNDERKNLEKAISEISAVTRDCDARVAEMTRQSSLRELQSKLILRPGMQLVELNLDHRGRELIFEGELQRMGGSRFTWQETHAILFDHYLVLAKSVQHRNPDGSVPSSKYDVNKTPIPMQLLVLESTDDEPVTKSTVKGIATVATVGGRAGGSSQLSRLGSSQSPVPGQLQHTNTSNSLTSMSTGSSLRTTNSNNTETPKEDKIMYPFRIKHLGKDEYTLYAPNAQVRSDWCAKIVEAKTKHAAGLFAQNAEPFRLRVMADSAFAYETGIVGQKGVTIRGTPLDRAIQDVEKLYQNSGRPLPVCRARVNCATAFMQPYGKNMVAVGTDNAVYIAEVDNPRGWTKAIQIPKVTQVAVLEEFSLFLLISDKSLIAYHLDAVCPVGGVQVQNDSARRAPQKLSGARDIGFFATGKMKDRTLVFYKKRDGLSSIFKVLEPVFQKSTEKKSRLFRSGRTEFFREYDEFYIPTECYGINLFNSSLAVSTSKGFETLTLDKKQTWSVPDLKQAHVADIAGRLAQQTPLGMFRLSDQEFLLCYEECAVYVNKHGDISRSVVMEFVGKAKTAALYGPYILLFDPDFVEIRNAQNGRLRQVIAGRDVKMLDDALSGGTAGHRTIKLCMQHPEEMKCQIVVELLLNEGLKE